MSRRYGRNQKRQHREALAAAERATDYWVGRASDSDNRARQLEGRLTRWAKEMAHLLSDYSPFQERVKQMRWDGGQTIRLHGPMNLPRMGREDVPIATTYNVIEAALSLLRVDKREFERSYYVELELPNRRFAYALDERMVRDPSPRFIERLAIDIAQQLRDAMRRMP